MNTEVINEIFKRRPARDFLRLYPSDKWKVLIPDIFEIGVLNLKNSFGTYKFTKKQIQDILIDLRNYKPDDDEINNNNLNEQNLEEDKNYNEENNNNNNEEGEYSENEENNEINDMNNNNRENNINININKQKEEIKERTAGAEVFIPDVNNMGIKVNYNRPKKQYNSTMEEIRERNIENKRNIGYAESRIKYQIMNDKKNHQMRKRKISNEEYNNDNDGNFSFNKNKNQKQKNLNKNYVINFDKNLNPEKPIEIQKNRYEYNYNNNINNNCSDFNEEDIFKNFNINNSNSFNNNSNSFNNNNDNNINNNQNVQNHLNNYKINMLNFPKFGFERGNLNNN